MSASSTHTAFALFERETKHCPPASAVERPGLKPYEFRSAVVSAMGSNANRYKACMARHFITGMPSGLVLPFFFRNQYSPKWKGRVTPPRQRRNRVGLRPR